MPIDPAAFRHHPALEGRIVDPDVSFYRTMQPADMDERMAEHGVGPDWRHTDEHREATRRAFFDRREDRGDLWVFAYGSLMWDPGFRFQEVCRARVIGWSRSLCLVDRFGGRGTKEAPGLMAALDRGDHCDGLAFRIRADEVEHETEILWRREMIAPCYLPVFARAETVLGEIDVLTFAADYDAYMIEAEITRPEQVQYLRTGQGWLGTSREYLENLLDQFKALEIRDPELESLMEEVDSLT
ncbi:gamma-glutamylcyclotransferase [Pelagovum pacificum]|uniref:glutathione-specific gamma-glutamylcyclotransferase n=1 Tax=Pelagovum pacificum TaxID=2588711 RepID=A0A5C5GG69_9RHOB|nr:gamma-glutamylcyclotransferase [Pelagovum pacificum]QQA43344.1 gamma-glutamylcyclotransferase [Pelagovum pacificum]TNY33520.1 gamma-glutamylcyclotransferase [Pelagovum pacificum]